MTGKGTDSNGKNDLLDTRASEEEAQSVLDTSGHMQSAREEMEGAVATLSVKERAQKALTEIETAIQNHDFKEAFEKLDQQKSEPFFGELVSAFAEGIARQDNVKNICQLLESEELEKFREEDYYNNLYMDIIDILAVQDAKELLLNAKHIKTKTHHEILLASGLVELIAQSEDSLEAYLWLQDQSREDLTEDDWKFMEEMPEIKNLKKTEKYKLGEAIKENELLATVFLEEDHVTQKEKLTAMGFSPIPKNDLRKKLAGYWTEQGVEGLKAGDMLKLDTLLALGINADMLPTLEGVLKDILPQAEPEEPPAQAAPQPEPQPEKPPAQPIPPKTETEKPPAPPVAEKKGAKAAEGQAPPLFRIPDKKEKTAKEQRKKEAAQQWNRLIEQVEHLRHSKKLEDLEKATSLLEQALQLQNLDPAKLDRSKEEVKRELLRLKRIFNYEKGRMLERQGETKKAIALLKQTGEIDAHFILSKIFEREKNLTEAILENELAVEKKPGYDFYLYNLLRLHARNIRENQSEVSRVKQAGLLAEILREAHEQTDLTLLTQGEAEALVPLLERSGVSFAPPRSAEEQKRDELRERMEKEPELKSLMDDLDNLREGFQNADMMGMVPPIYRDHVGQYKTILASLKQTGDPLITSRSREELMDHLVDKFLTSNPTKSPDEIIALMKRRLGTILKAIQPKA